MDVSDSITQLMDNKADFLGLILFRQEIYGFRALGDPEGFNLKFSLIQFKR